MGFGGYSGPQAVASTPFMKRGVPMKRSCLALFTLILVLMPGIVPAQERMLDVPFVPTPQKVVDEMLRLASVSKSDFLYDLGCGDGRIVITAAERFGTRGVGVDLNPVRIAESRENATKAGVTNLVRFVEGDLFQADFRQASVVTLYLLTSVNIRLRPKLFEELRPGSRVVSHDFSMDTWRPDQNETITVEGSTHNLYFWVIPANISGTWQVAWTEGARKQNLGLSVDQQFQMPIGKVTSGGSGVSVKDFAINGDKIKLTLEREAAGKTETLVLEGSAVGDTIQGTVKPQTGGTAAGTFTAKRDPGTMKPIDVGSEPKY